MAYVGIDDIHVYGKSEGRFNKLREQKRYCVYIYKPKITQS